MMTCTLTLSEVPLHLYQVIASFVLLERSGKIKLKIVRLPADSPQRLPYNMLLAEIDGKQLIYDMNDGYDNLPESASGAVSFYNGLLEKCDFMFKRSFNEQINSSLCSAEKVKKTAPNFLVTVRGNPAHFPVPCDPRREKIKKLVRMLPGTQFYNGCCLEKKFIAPPLVSEKPRALFMARLWDPAGEFPGQLSDEKSEERREINQSRVQCIRFCRKELGDSFFGGITPSAFAQREYPDIVLDDASLGKKDRYLAFMKDFDIQVATAGLHGSTGWKFAEYIAASRAIVTEPLFYESAGGLESGKNYFEFTSAQQCAQQITALFDTEKRADMMRCNSDYFEKNMRCEVFIKNTLAQAGININ